MVINDGVKPRKGLYIYSMADLMHSDTPHSSGKRWVQPSLSRDFAVLAAAILFITLLISALVTWLTYQRHVERISTELHNETLRVEATLESQITAAGYLLEAIGRQITINEAVTAPNIAKMLQAYAVGNPKYALWSWVDTQGTLVASSNYGVLDKPVRVQDRDYVSASITEPGVIHIGTPIEGRVSQRWVIPVGMGVTDTTGRLTGVLAASLDINTITEQISSLVKRDGVSFAVYSRDFTPLTFVPENAALPASRLPVAQLKEINTLDKPSGLLSKTGLFSGDDGFAYYLASETYPYVIIVGYDPQASDMAMRSMLWPRLVQLLVVAVFLLALLGIIRSRFITPAVELEKACNRLARGEAYDIPARTGSQEIEQLSWQISRVARRLDERNRLEEELRSKIGLLQHRYHHLHMEMRQRAMLLAGLLGEYKQSLRSINGYAQVMKDQLYGPLENKKYRQYAADIHQSGTTLELMIRKLIALSRVDATAFTSRAESVPLGDALEKALQFTQLPEAEYVTDLPMIRLHTAPELQNVVVQADGVHLRQGLSYLLLYLASAMPDPHMHAALRLMSAAKGEAQPVLLLGEVAENLSDDHLREALSQPLPMVGEGEQALPALQLSLAQAVLASQKIQLGLIGLETGGLCGVLAFAPSDVVIQDQP